ncbi:MAG: aldehyde ferredoxin oxidoreductase N-terminal domain-containing protein [Bacteroidota bacterium]
MARVLYIDLSKKSFWIEDRNDLLQYIGGAGIATKLLLEECPEGTDPLSPGNPVIFAVGPLTGIFPLASKTVAMFKSPLTGNLGESHAGGRSATSIRMAGYGAIVIRGKSDVPVYLSIHSHKVEFKNATTIWGMSSSLTAGKIIRENEKGNGFRTIMRIGQAGETMVSYAAVTTETYRHFGRLGLGAVFGSKMLKGIAITGNSTIEIADHKAYKKLYDKVYAAAVDTDLMKKYHDLGTAGNVITLNELNALPVRNLNAGSMEEIKELTGEYLAENYLGRRVACAHCPIGCVHLANLREASDHEAYFYKTTMVGYDFELLYSLGSMLGMTKTEDVLRLIDMVEVYGMDAMSTGVVLAWATEMLEKKLISPEETAGIQFAWNNVEEYMKAMRKIVMRENDFYDALAQGVDFASEKYGGKEFAMAFGKNEMPGYHTGPATYLGYLVGARHSHLDNAGYSLDQKELIHEYVAPETIIDKLMHEEEFRQIMSSLVICFFARGIYNKEMMIETLGILGVKADDKMLDETGKEIYRMKYEFKFRHGFSFDNMHIPDRIYNTSDPTGQIKKEYIEKGLAYIKKKLKPG